MKKSRVSVTRRALAASAGAAVAVSLAGFGTASAASAPSASARAVAAKAAAARLLVKDLRIGGVKALSDVTSDNWSGYADDNSAGNTYTQVSGRWAEPAVTCQSSSDSELAAFWVGIDGYNDNTVEQDGTIAQCYEGSTYYYDWWEMYPTNDIQVVSQVSAGDEFISSATYANGAYTLKVTDKTDPAASFTTTQTCMASSGCANASAELIAERPSGSNGLYVLPDYGTWSVGSVSVVSGAKGRIGSYPDDAITMENSSDEALSTPGPLNRSSGAFTTQWQAYE